MNVASKLNVRVQFAGCSLPGRRRESEEMAVPDKDDDWGKVQTRMTRAIISELRDDLEDLLRGLKAGTLDYITALKTLKILLQEDLDNPLVGAVDVKYQKARIPIDQIDVPPELRKKKKGKPGRRK
jgi:hypothetical protein